MIRNLNKLLAAFLAIGLSCFSYATKETYSVRKSAGEITIGSSFEVIDGRFVELGLDHFKDKSTRFLVKFGIEEREDYGYFGEEATIDALVRIEALNHSGETETTKTEHLIIEYNPAGGVNAIDLDAVLDGGYHRYRVTVDDITLTGVATIPDYVFIEGELQIDRYYELDRETVPAIATIFTAYNDANIELKHPGIGTGDPTADYIGEPTLSAQEIELFWPYIEGAEEYELEWTWVDNYHGDNFGLKREASAIDFSERDFELNNTRIITRAQTYRIPLIYARGYLIYRVRAVGRWTDNDLQDTEKRMFGQWSSADAPSLETVANWPHYIEISSDHEAIKNWQYQAVYAEEGKKKEIISYFDGSLRNRQTVTRINSNNQAIVGENIYDNQGRSAIQILPTPVENAALRYYVDLNNSTADGNPVYTHHDFDWDPEPGSCISPVIGMDDGSGASKYYSDNNSIEDTWQDYVPDAEDFPFVQVEYTPDNTGRIRRQSGVGADYTIASGRAARYYYLQPQQAELNRLFGYKVGNAQHYKKNLVIDANGQVSISYIDPQGRVVATALAGDNAGESGGTKTNLLSLTSHGDGDEDTDDDGDENHNTVTTDLLNKLNAVHMDTEADNNHRYISGKQGAGADGLRYNAQYASTDDQMHSFEYTVETDRFRDNCMADDIYYPFAYDLAIDLRDDCGTGKLVYAAETEGDPEDVVPGIQETFGGATDGYTGAEGTSRSYLHEDLTAFLESGAYTLSKLITVNEDTLENHLQHYLENLEPGCLPDFLVSTADCPDGNAYPDIIDGEYILSDFDLTACNISTQTMESDLMPGGQYGGTDPDDRASIFHPENVLAQGAFEDLGKNWQNIPVNADGEIIEYRDENGDLSLIEVVLDDEDDPNPEDCVPALTDVFSYTTIDGIHYVKPQYLRNSEDFIANWEGPWAKSLLPYHPEYPYYEKHYKILCEAIWPGTMMVTAEGEPAVPVSSESYNLALQFITTFNQASTADNPFLTSLVPLSGASHPIRSLDPYFNLNYGHLEELNDDTEYEESSVNTYKGELMDLIMDEYKDNNQGPGETDLNLWEYAVKIVVCGSDFTDDCDLTGGVYPGDAFFDEDLSDAERDQIWNTYKQFYLAEKRRIDQILLDSYAIRHGFFNEYIGSAEPVGVGFGAFIYYGAPHVGYSDEIGLNAIYLDAVVEEGYDDGGGAFPWFDNDDVDLFAEKVKRFEPVYGLYDAGLPEGDVLLGDMAAYADAAIFTSTGQCGMLRDAENFLRALAENSLLFDGAAINSNEFPWLTDDLYDGMNGELPAVNPIGIQVDIATNLEVKVNNGATGTFFKTDGTPMHSITINAPAVDFEWNWSDITTLRMLYYASESETGGIYPFQILAQLDEVTVDGETVYREVVLNGTTKVKIGDCFTEEGLEEPLCSRDENFAADIRATFTALYNAETGDFALHTNADPLATLGGWFASSEIAVQLGDNPASPSAKLASTSNSFTLKLDDLDRAIEVVFPGLPVVDISLVTGAAYNDSTGAVTLYYIDESGTEGTLTGSVTSAEMDGETSDFIQLDCMCDEEADYSVAMEKLLNELLTENAALEASGETWNDVYGESPWYTSEATEFLEDFTLDRENTIESFGMVDGPGGFLFFDVLGTACDFRLKMEGLTDFSNITHIYGLEFRETHADSEYAFEMTAYAVLESPERIVEISLSHSSGNFFNSKACFRKIGCGCTSPATLAPKSCTDELAVYNGVIEELNAAIPSLDDYEGEDADDLYDVSFPVIAGDDQDVTLLSGPYMMREGEFCSSRLAYGVEAYLEYLDHLSITSTDNENYLSLAAFNTTGLNHYYLNDLEHDGTAWVEDVDGSDLLIDPVQMYKKYLDDGGPYLNWNDYVDGIYLTEQSICPPNSLPYYPTFEWDGPCEEWTANTDTVNAKNQEEIYLEKLAKNFRERYVEKAVSSLVETFAARYNDKEYHYTLYYYDQAGNLIQTVPPKGVKRLEADEIDNDLINITRATPGDPEATPSNLPTHTFTTNYQYNSLNQLVWQSTPDGGESHFGYDKLGRLVVSQNANQRLAGDPAQEQFSYTRYDALGRIIEVGEMTLEGDYGFDENGRFVDPDGEPVNVSAADFPLGLGTALKKQEEVTKTQYDQLKWMDPSKFKDYAAENTRNRITGVYYYEALFDGEVYFSPDSYDNATFYDYDVHGNVKELIQDNNDQHLQELAQDEKKVEYEYDLVSGNVKHVTYQKDKPDQFIHEYEYDADNRITNVRTSHDNVLWEQDAKYFYYNHGPLARTEIGDKKVQSNDFAYTIQGWLKGVNSENLSAPDDQGKDGRYATAGVNKMNGKDVFGYSLHYYDGDYNARFGNDFLSYSDGTTWPATHNLYNGNIREMYTAGTNTAEANIGTSHTIYKYDQLNRIRSMEQELLTGIATPVHSDPEGTYESKYTYDQNGNLKTLKRWAENDLGAKVPIDDFIYNYVDETANNQLDHVYDGEGQVLDTDLASQIPGNYDYDEIGQLIQDKQEGIAEIQWKVTGKVHRIIRSSDSSKDNLEFVYDAMGNRIMKIVTDTSGHLLAKTYYIRDAQGNVMSIYNLTQTYNPNGDVIQNLHLTERSIYGSSRVGTENPEGLLVAKTGVSLLEEFPYERTVGDKRYELSNHLGNVHNVITDRKLQVRRFPESPEVEYYMADVVRQEDYFPFGMSTGVDAESGIDFRYGFNGMEDDNEVTNADRQSYDFGARFYNPRIGRFLSLDPKKAEFTAWSPYLYAGNTPILFIDENGEGPIIPFQSYVASQRMKAIINRYEAGEVSYDIVLKTIDHYMNVPFATWENMDYAERKLEEGGINIYSSGDAQTKEGIWLHTSPDVAYVAGETDDAILHITLIDMNEDGEWVEVKYEIVDPNTQKAFAEEKVSELRELSSQIDELSAEIEKVSGELGRARHIVATNRPSSHSKPRGVGQTKNKRIDKSDAYAEVSETAMTTGAAMRIAGYELKLKELTERYNDAVSKYNKGVEKLQENSSVPPGVHSVLKMEGTRKGDSDPIIKSLDSGGGVNEGAGTSKKGSHTHRL